MRALAWFFGLLLAWVSVVEGAAVQLQWEYPVSPPIATFRLYRHPGACPVSGWLAQNALRVTSADSQEVVGEAGQVVRAIDGESATHWHTAYIPTAVSLPHTMVLDLGATYLVDGLRYLPRQDGGRNGTIAGYQVSVSQDGQSWPPPVAVGIWGATTTEKGIAFGPIPGRYVRFVATSEIGGGPWTSAAEVRIGATPLVPPPGTPLATVAGTVRQYTDTTVPTTGVFCWFIVAVDAAGRVSGQSNAAQYPDAPVAAPSGLRLVP